MPNTLQEISGKALGKLFFNLSVPALYEAAIRNERQVVASNGALVAMTGSRTGRSPRDKWVVEEPGSKSKIWWGKVNQAMSEEGVRLFRRARCLRA